MAWREQPVLHLQRPGMCPALPASPGPQQSHVLPRHKSRPRRCRAVAARVSHRPCALALPAGTMALALLLPAALLLLLLLYLGFVRCFTAAPSAVFQCRERVGAAGFQPPRDAVSRGALEGGLGEGHLWGLPGLVPFQLQALVTFLLSSPPCSGAPGSLASPCGCLSTWLTR